jgi:hypothetical protein
MRHHSWPIGILAVACGLLANAAPARAAAQTWVSGTGTDTGNCPITAPCRTFQFAHGQTNAGGTINVLSPGSFGALTITKSIGIVADGVEAAILGAGGSGAAIIVQADADDIVSLRGLTINLRGAATDGISFVSGAALHVHNSVIRGAVYGIRFAPASGASELHVADSVIACVIAEVNTRGVGVEPTGSGGAKVVLDRVRVEKSTGNGMSFSSFSTTGSISATVRDSVSTGSSNGILAEGGGSGTTTVMIDRTAAVNNGAGIVAIGAGATIRIGDSTVSGNSSGLSAFSGGAIASYGTNKVNGNGTEGVPTSTIAMK